MNRLYDISESINFGQMKNEPFKWIFLLSLPYLRWLICNTNVCFQDLSEFYQFGKPLKLNPDLLTEGQGSEILNIARELGNKNYSKKGESYLVTIEIYSKLLERNILQINQFEEYDFEFEKDLIDLNKSKLESSKRVYSLTNISRNEYLSELFKS